MKTYQLLLRSQADIGLFQPDFKPDLVLAFISPLYEAAQETVAAISARCPESIIAGCSTSGEIHDLQVIDSSISLTAIQFAETQVKACRVPVGDMKDSREIGNRIVEELSGEKLRHLLIFSDGLHVNGAELVSGLKDNLPADVTVTGGLAGDGADFNQTFTVYNTEVADRHVVAIGFYGDALKVACGSKGGWDSFGIEREVTRSHKNVLYELDGKPALELYKTFLGDKADELPGSGLLFPLSMRDEENALPVVRTILAINEEEQSLTFAGNIPEGSYVRLMKANVDRLITGAELSAEVAGETQPKEGPDFALLISCVGRRLVLKQMVEEEVEAVRDVLGAKASMTGFYSYGEIAPFGEFSPCQLHNQTMTITTFSE